MDFCHDFFSMLSLSLSSHFIRLHYIILFLFLMLNGRKWLFVCVCLRGRENKLGRKNIFTKKKCQVWSHRWNFFLFLKTWRKKFCVAVFIFFAQNNGKRERKRDEEENLLTFHFPEYASISITIKIVFMRKKTWIYAKWNDMLMAVILLW